MPALSSDDMHLSDSLLYRSPHSGHQSIFLAAAFLLLAGGGGGGSSSEKVNENSCLSGAIMHAFVIRYPTTIDSHDPSGELLTTCAFVRSM